MPLVTAPDGLRIAYEVVGEGGPPLVLHHGLGGDRRQWWSAGYVDAFRTNTRVVLVDALGRGESDRPHDPAAYGIPRHAADVLRVLDAEGVERAVFWGWSVGGRVGFEIAARHPDRLVALVATGATGHGFEPDPDELEEHLALFDRGMEDVVAVWSENTRAPAWLRAQWLESDPAAIVASLRANAGYRGIADALPRLTVPVLMLIGDRDPLLPLARETAATAPRAVLAELEDRDHTTAFTESDVPVALTLEFLRGP